MSINRRRFLFNTGLTLAGVAASYKSVSDTAFALEPTNANDLSSWANVRAQFAVSPEYIHLSSFFLASHPRPVREAIEKNRRALDDNPLLAVEEEEFGQPLKIEKRRRIGRRKARKSRSPTARRWVWRVYHVCRSKPDRKFDTRTTIIHHESIRRRRARRREALKNQAL